MKIEHKKLTFILALVTLILALVGCGIEPTAGDDAATVVPVIESEPSANKPVDTDAEPIGEKPVEEDNIYCTVPGVHPIGESISQTYDVSYEEVMSLFCSGFTFDNILLAFQTSQQTGDSPRELLHMKQTMSWDEIWAEVGVLDDG